MKQLAIIGGGNIGLAIARGLVRAGDVEPGSITISRRTESALAAIGEEGFATTTDNREAVAGASSVLLCVQPAQAVDVLTQLQGALDPEQQLVISVVTGVPCAALTDATRSGNGNPVPVVRAMPNTAVSNGESMTCIASHGASTAHVETVVALFDKVGSTLVISEDLMTQATALCACGIAFFLRAIRAASQGGIEIGFHAEEALAMAAQTARGAASLLASGEQHPEGEIDRVTTPMGCTIAGLNQMEHEGFSSAMIKGIVTSARKAGTLGGATPADQ
jgi:pyrroline-5-carboxylate reductase